jgi:hypothetical protein
MTEATLLNRLKRFGYGQHHGPMAKACAEAADEIERLRAALRAISTTSIWTGDAGSQQTYEGVRAYARDTLNPPSA